MLKIQFKDKRREPVWIVENHFTIGSSRQCNLYIDDPDLAEQHATIFHKDKTLFLRADESHPPCTVNGQLIKECEIRPGDSVQIGVTELDILHPHESITQPVLSDDRIPKWGLVASSSWLNGKEFLIEKPKIIIGRSNQCDIVIPGTHLSRQHAEVSIQGNQLLIKDLASSNGTYVNGKKITEATAKEGDEIRFDIYPFKVNGPNTDHDKTRVRKVSPSKTQEPVKPSALPPKKWKTKPTSPGNRVEAVKQSPARMSLLLSLLLLAAMLGAFTYLGLV